MEKAYGNPRTESVAPFTVDGTPATKGFTGRTYLGAPNGFVVAGEAPVYVGGMPYSTVGNGDSEPVVIPAHGTARITLVRKGCPASFSVIKVEDAI